MHGLNDPPGYSRLKAEQSASSRANGTTEDCTDVCVCVCKYVCMHKACLCESSTLLNREQRVLMGQRRIGAGLTAGRDGWPGTETVLTTSEYGATLQKGQRRAHIHLHTPTRKILSEEKK